MKQWDRFVHLRGMLNKGGYAEEDTKGCKCLLRQMGRH